MLTFTATQQRNHDEYYFKFFDLQKISVYIQLFYVVISTLFVSLSFVQVQDAPSTDRRN
jgi:hypothetical protein